jgi:hypothetical protein
VVEEGSLSHITHTREHTNLRGDHSEMCSNVSRLLPTRSEVMFSQQASLLLYRPASTQVEAVAIPLTRCQEKIVR